MSRTRRNDAEELTRAAADGDIERLLALLDAGESVDGTDALDRSALHRAASSRRREIVDLLLSRGAPVEALEHKKRSALHYAAREAWPEMVLALLSAGARAEVQDTYLGTPLHDVASNTDEDRAHDRLAVAAALVEAGCPLDHQARSGRTALWHAAALGHQDLVRLLLEMGADPTLAARGQQGTPLDAARAAGHDAVVQLLEAR